MQIWEREWDMEFNPSKYQVLHITKNKKVINNKYFHHGQALTSFPSSKYLGLDLSTDINYNTHILRIIYYANKTLGFIKRNINTKNEKVKQLAYKSLARPQLGYASTV
jgi:hypothetical protein